MTSPVYTPYKSFITIERTSSTAIYLQIAVQMINAIQRGFLVKGMKLPGTRALSQLLDVHRNTIVAAYNELDAQGWVETRPNKGTFVLSKLNDKPQKIKYYDKKELAQYPSGTGFNFKKSNILDSPFEPTNCELSFNDGLPDSRLLQLSQLSKFYSSNLKRRSNRNKLTTSNQDGSDYFKVNLSNYLNLTRGLHISKNNIMTTRSTEMSIYIAVETLISPKDVVIVGKLGYFATNMIFQKAGAEINSVPIDDEGIDVEAIKRLCEKKIVRLLYLTPHHHYPTTVTLSAQRRIELLKLSAHYGFIILEDDYDYDFHFDNRPVLPLASSDTQGMVVYIGSFGKSLAPGFRSGFIIAPQNLIYEMRKFLGIIDRQGDALMEQVLGEMISEGEIHRYLKKELKVYRERRDHFEKLLRHYLGAFVEFKIPSGGLAFWTKWHTELNLMRISKECAHQNLYLPKMLLYQTKELTAMRLGFGHLTFDEQELIISKLYRSLILSI